MIIRLGHNLGLKVVAEGVESAAVAEQLAAWGCDSAQGFHYSPALPPDELSHWLAGRATPATPG